MRTYRRVGEGGKAHDEIGGAFGWGAVHSGRGWCRAKSARGGGLGCRVEGGVTRL